MVVGMKTCRGCNDLMVEDAGKGRVFYICGRCNFGSSSKRVLASLPKGAIFEENRPAWCEKGGGYDACQI